MHCSALICSNLSRLFSDCNSLYSVTVFPKQGKMEQVTAGCSSKMVVKIREFYYRYFVTFLSIHDNKTVSYLLAKICFRLVTDKPFLLKPDHHIYCSLKNIIRIQSPPSSQVSPHTRHYWYIP